MSDKWLIKVEEFLGKNVFISLCSLCSVEMVRDFNLWFTQIKVTRFSSDWANLVPRNSFMLRPQK